MRPVVLFLISVALLAACNQRKDQIAFDGQYFRAKASKAGDRREDFVVTVKPVSASPEGALEAGRYQATRYCVLQFGSSEIDWVVGPDQDAGTLVAQNDEITLQGTCEG